MEKLHLEFGGYSTAGVKEENQDAFAAWLPTGSELTSKGAVATIADGVSSCSKAKEAAITCATNFIQDYSQTPETWTVKRAATQVLQGLNRWCAGQHEYSLGDHSQMVTTFSALIFKSTTAFLFHAGDSRICRLQQGDFEQLSTDHHARFGNKKVLSRAIGIENNLEVDFRTFELRKNDLFLLTTDGVHEFVSTKKIQSILNHWLAKPNISLEELAKFIVDSAIKAGSDDNLSCLLIKVAQLPQGDLNEYHRQLTRLAMPPALKEGMKLEGYRVLEQIFNGTRSSLYKVIKEDTQTLYCLKTPSQYFVDDPIYLSGFLREEWIGQKLNHVNIMKIIPRPENAKFMYHVCEFIDGQTLRQWMLDNPAPTIVEVRSLIKQLIAALRIFQRQDMVHRDIKPENVMITTAGEVKLIDFGTVYVGAIAETQVSQDESVPVGSVNYIAPEYLLDNQFDFRSDLFSVAVVCFEMLTGHLPFKEGSPQSSSGLTADNWRYLSLRQFRPDLPQWLDITLAKGLVTNPQQRYQAFSEFLMDLNKPNTTMLAQTQHRPLIQRHPLKLFKIIALIEFIIILLLLNYLR
ncbi:bifunctional protein-serine/threonine kinase/phosphatase [Aliiglaciecola sp. 3_MG-2023]|uniref:bifunctional protein-serine/threonine kinase/phosphatase n=1 Tax=Aliiglaciecola sp. 3_MG-2023 TaxID=3062644 RepID=UPI0026E20FC5|nr:bifunctional protein-serine/threonine kinase/phosphatase [Aliiglaciecola sp. 3_MG-2023]MDO6695163.1 bifunctional protein-serine/threonine kinase/phosphatase [Aliiglaciecola sp. 3_MG-2023]